MHIKTLLNLNLETMLIVTVWQSPFIFQGYFKIKNNSNNDEHLLFFRCECFEKEQLELLTNDFSPANYQFTDLYQGEKRVNLEQIDAQYLLKYALDSTVKKMLLSSYQHKLVIDEIAMQAIINQVEPILMAGQSSVSQADIGFAVAMDFTPQDELANNAAQALLAQFTALKKTVTH